MSPSVQRVLARATIASSALLLGQAADAGVQITHYDSYTQEAKLTGEGAGMWCADPNDAAVAIGITTVTTPEHMIAVAGNPQRIAAENILVQRSKNGGVTWTPVLRSLGEGAEYDPACAFGNDGHAYLVVMGWGNHNLRGFNFWRSTDRGVSWSAPWFVDYPEFYDRPFLSVDNSNSRYRGRVYVAAATMVMGTDTGKSLWDSKTRGRIVIMTSDDGGQSFAPTVHIETGVGVGDGVIHMAPTAVFSDGTYLATWSEGELPSVGMGGMFDPPHKSPPGVPPGFRFAVTVARSTDGGATFSAPQRLAVSEWWQIVGRYTIETGKWYPALALDTTNGRYADSAYLVWNEVKNGRSRIVFTRSRDRGVSWQSPMPVAPTAAFHPTDIGTGPEQLMTSIAVNRDGVIGVSYYQSALPDKDGYYWAMFSYSRDGGDTWSAPVRVTAEPITRHDLAEHEKWLDTRRIKTVPGKAIPPEHTLGSFPTCRWDLIAAADGDFLMFPLSTPDDLWTTTPIRLHVISQ